MNSRSTPFQKLHSPLGNGFAQSPQAARASPQPESTIHPGGLYNRRHWQEACLKRIFVILTFGVLAFPTLQAQQKPPCATAGTNNAFLGIQTVRLWPGDAPQAKASACEDTPALTILDPQPGHANGSAVVVFPGGA